MNKLLQHIIDAGDVDHRVLPGLQKMQKGGDTDWLSKYKQDLKNMPYVNLSSNDNIPRQPAYVKEYEQQQQYLKNKKEREQKELLQRQLDNRTYISQDNRTAGERENDRLRLLEAKRQEAMGNSELAQTFGSFTPSGNNPAAGAVAANQFVKTAPFILAGGAGAAALPEVMAALNAPIGGVAGLTGTNLINAGFAYQGAKNIPNVARSIKDAYQNPSLSNVGNAALETGVTALDMMPFAAEVAPGVKAAVNASKESGLLSNSWKVNPRAYQYNLPENVMYRGLGEEGMKDALASGVFRAKQNVQPSMQGRFDMSKQFSKAYFSPKFNVADSYGQGYIAEVPRDATTWGNRYANGKTWSQIAQSDIPTSQGRILQKDWLQGYKPVNMPVNGVATEADKTPFWQTAGESLLRGLKKIKPGYVENKLALVDRGNDWTRGWYDNSIIKDRYNNWIEKGSDFTNPENALFELNMNYAMKGSGLADLPESLARRYNGTIARNNLENFLQTGKATKGVTNRLPGYNTDDVVGQYKYDDNSAVIDVLNSNIYKKGYTVPNTTVHENIHYLTRGDLGLTPNSQKFLQRPFNIDPVTMYPARGSSAYDKYLTKPTEVHARIGELRRSFGLKPEQEVDYNTLNKIIDAGKKGETTVNPQWFNLIDNKSDLKWLFNNAPAIAAPVVAGAALSKQKYGGQNNMFRVFAEDGVEYKGPSIVDYLATKGYSGDKAFRKGLAEKYGVEDYNYSAAKNTELLNKLRENDDLLQKEYEQTQTPVPVERIMQMEQRQAAPVRNTQPLYRPAFMDQEVPKTKVNFSLQPKVVYDKFSLTPKMVIPMPVTPRRAAVNTPAPVVQPVAAPTPQVNIPRFDPYSYMTSGVQNPVVAAPPVNTPVPFNSKTAFNNYDPSEPFAFLKQNPNNLGPYTKENVPVVIPANKPVVETKKQSAADIKKTTWYEDLYNGFEDAVNKSPLDFSKMTMAPSGFTPEGAKAMVKDITVRAAGLISPEKGKLVDNYFKRQDLKNNDNLQETKTKFKIPTSGRPAIATGDTINIDKNRYVIPAMIDLNQTNWDARNRDEYKDIDTEAADITTFQSFEKAKDYFAKNAKDANNSTYIGVDAAGKVKVGNKADFLNTDYRITKTFGNKIVDFVDEPNGSMKLKNSSAKASNKHLSPVVKVLGDDGKMTEGSMNLLIPKGNRDTKSFGQITGGRVIFKTPKGEQFLVSGSAEDIRNAFKQIKGDNPYVEAITLDNGSYAMGLRNKNQKITAKELKDYQGSNTTGSAFLYLKPGNYSRGTNQVAPQTQFRDVPMNTPNIRTKNDESFKKGHPLTNEQKAIILHHTGYSDTTGVSKGMSKAMQGVNKQFSQPGESSHVVIDFDGTRYNYARPDQVTFHAGKSMMNGRDNVNDFGVGIEFQGDTDKTRLTDKQINSFVEYAGPIIKKNKIPLSSIITHKQIRTNYMKANPKDKEVLGKPDVNQIDYDRIIKVLKKKGYYAQGGPVVVDPMGQWAHPGEVTRIPGSDITMQGVNYPVLGLGSNGKKQMMYPGQDYNFGGAQHVDEYPMMQNGGGLLSRTVSCSNCGWSWKAVDGGSDPLTCHKCGGMVKMKNGGQHGGLDRWFAEKWVDIKTGKTCGRQEGESRAGYPACRPSKRINSQTPKTFSELSASEKAKFKSSKTSSQRIDYNHKRNK